LGLGPPDLEIEMTTRQVIGVVTAVTGAAIGIFHLILMVFTDLPSRYHANELWIALAFALAVAGLVLLGTDKKR